MTYHPIEPRNTSSTSSSIISTAMNGAGAVAGGMAYGAIFALTLGFCAISTVLRMNGQSGEGSIGLDGLTFKIGPE